MISKRKVFVFFITLCFVPPAYLQRYSIVLNIYNLLRVALSLYAITAWIGSKIRHHSSIKSESTLYILLIAFFYSFILLSTIINKNRSQYLATIINLVFSIGFCMLIDLEIKKDFFKTVEAIKNALGLLTFLNVITVILFPNGLYLINAKYSGAINSAFFLGHRNNSIEVYIPFLGLSILSSHITKKRIDIFTYVALAACMFTVIHTWSVNSILCLAFILIYVLFLYKRRHFALFSSWTFVIASLFFTVILAVFQGQRYFEFLIVSVFRKRLDITSRALIWEKSMYYIKQSLLYGYGVESTEKKHLKIIAVNSCHNYWVDVAYYGGIILLIAFFALIVITLRRMYQKNDLKIADIFSAAFGAYCILFIATPIHRNSLSLMFVFMLIMYSSNKEQISLIQNAPQ